VNGEQQGEGGEQATTTPAVPHDMQTAIAMIITGLASLASGIAAIMVLRKKAAVPKPANSAIARFR